MLEKVEEECVYYRGVCVCTVLCILFILYKDVCFMFYYTVFFKPQVVKETLKRGGQAHRTVQKNSS